MKLSRGDGVALIDPVTRIVVWFVKFNKHVFRYFSEAGGFRVEDRGLSFPSGGNLDRLPD
jgi:hypothetical protein